MASSARIEELERKFNENPRRYFAPLANEYRKAGDLEQAIAICRTYVPQQPAHMSGHIVFGQALFEAGEHEEARGVFEAALALDPENLIALRHLGDIARERGEMSAAKTWYQRVLDADPRNDEVAILLSALDGAATRPAPECAHVGRDQSRAHSRAAAGHPRDGDARDGARRGCRAHQPGVSADSAISRRDVRHTAATATGGAATRVVARYACAS